MVLNDGIATGFIDEMDISYFSCDMWNGINDECLPAWDLGTLIGMLPEWVNIVKMENTPYRDHLVKHTYSYDLCIGKDCVVYSDEDYGVLVKKEGSLFESVVSIIEWLVENKHIKGNNHE